MGVVDPVDATLARSQRPLCSMQVPSHARRPTVLRRGTARIDGFAPAGSRECLNRSNGRSRRERGRDSLLGAWNDCCRRGGDLPCPSHVAGTGFLEAGRRSSVGGWSARTDRDQGPRRRGRGHGAGRAVPAGVDGANVRRERTTTLDRADAGAACRRAGVIDVPGRNANLTACRGSLTFDSIESVHSFGLRRSSSDLVLPNFTWRAPGHRETRVHHPDGTPS